MNRQILLILGVVVLIVANIVWHIYRDWGLVTVDAENKPIAEVVRTIERQGHITITNGLPAETLVTMHVRKVPASEALETLATVTDSNWRLSYFLAPDRVTILGGLESLKSGQRPQGWKVFRIPTPQLTDEDELFAPDPRGDLWTVTAPSEPNLQAYLNSGSQLVNASFSVPETWNPSISSPPKSGKAADVVAKLASKARGKWEERFVLSKWNRRGPGENVAGGADQPDRANQPDRPRFDPALRAERMQAQIQNLPPEKRAAAQERFNAERAFWEGLRALSPEERRAKIEERFSDPEVQGRMDDRMARRDARMTPQQRLQRYQRYVQRKQELKAGAMQPQPAPAGR